MERHPNPKVAYSAAAVLVIALAAGGYAFAKNFNTATSTVAPLAVASASPASSPSATATATATSTPTATPTASATAAPGMKIYTNASTGLTFQYPTTLSVFEDASFGANTSFADMGDILEVELNRPDVEGPLVEIQVSTKSIDDVIAASDGQWGTKTGAAVTIGGQPGGTLNGAYGSGYTTFDGKTYLFQQQNRSATSDEALYNNVVASVTFSK